MRTGWLWSALILAVWQETANSADAQTPPSPPPYASLRYDEDSRYLRDPARRTKEGSCPSVLEPTAHHGVCCCNTGWPLPTVKALSSCKPN